MEETEDGSLKILATGISKEETVKTIKIEGLDIDQIYHRTQNAYFKGFKKIILLGLLTKDQFKVIERIQKRLSGLEVTEQEENSLTFSDILDKESLNIDKNLNYVFSVLINMASEIMEYIEKEEEPEDKIFEMGGLALRKCNLIYRCCNICLTDSSFLSKNKKTLHEITTITRILKNLEMLIKLLDSVSYIINTKQTPMMKKYHYPTFEKDKKVYKIISEYMKKWIKYIKKIRTITLKKDSEAATEFYKTRFIEKLKIKEKSSNKQLNFFKTTAEMLNRNSSSIIRDVITI